MSLGNNPDLPQNPLQQRLLDAARLGYLEDIKVLLKQGANINTKDSFGDTPLAKAVQGHHTPVALLLIESGASLDSRSDRGNTALIWAAMNNNTEVVRAMLAKGADPAIKNDQGSTALALIKNRPTVSPEVVRMLEEALERKSRAEAKERERIVHTAISAKQQRLKQQAGQNRPTVRFEK